MRDSRGTNFCGNPKEHDEHRFTYGGGICVCVGVDPSPELVWPGPVIPGKTYSVGPLILGHVVDERRWDGQNWVPLEPGDWCLHAGTHAAVFWTGSRWARPRVTDGHVNDLAAVLCPEAWEDPETPEQSEVRAGLRSVARAFARRALAFGYIHRLNPAADPEKR